MNGETALKIAVERGHTEIVQVLIDRGAKIDLAMLTAMAGGEAEPKKIEIYKLLLRASHRGMLYEAVENGYINVAKDLLTVAELDDINAENRNGETALQIAAECGHTEIIIALLEKKAELEKAFVMPTDPDKKGSLGFFNGFFKTPVVDIKVNDWAKALHFAAKSGRLTTVKEILKHVNVNTKDNNGKTALHLAAENGHAEVVAELLENKKINVNAKDNENKTVLDLVTKKGVANMLIAKGAKSNNKKWLQSSAGNSNKENITFNNPLVSGENDRSFQLAPLRDNNTPEPTLPRLRVIPNPLIARQALSRVGPVSELPELKGPSRGTQVVQQLNSKKASGSSFSDSLNNIEANFGSSEIPSTGPQSQLSQKPLIIPVDYTAIRKRKKTK